MMYKFNWENNKVTWVPRALSFIAFVYSALTNMFSIIYDIQIQGFLRIVFCFLFGWGVWIVAFIIIFLITGIVGSYGPGGYLYNWYDRTFKMMGTSWIFDVWLDIKGIISTNENDFINFISPSGNKGKYEKVLFDKISSQNKVNFIVSDKLILKNYEKSISYNDSNFTYIPGKNAFDIKNTINQCNLETVNVIWDFKGMLWYSTNSFAKRYTDTLRSFENYHSTLTDNGVIVIDSIYVNPAFCFINSQINLLLGFRFGLGEVSTAQKLDRVLNSKKGEAIKNYLDLNFVKYDISNSNKQIVRIYKKKILTKEAI